MLRGLHGAPVQYASMWFFRSPTIVFGEDALLHIRELRGKKAFVVTDKTLNAQRLLAPVLIQLERAGMQIETYDAVESEPGLEAIEGGADMMNATGPDWIVAVGGGSVLDAAKAMWVLYENPDLDLEQVNSLEPITLRERARLIAVPTTAGAGSEATWTFEVTLDEGGVTRKFSSGHPSAMPDYAIVDPVMSASMPPELRAASGMDALTQAIEGYLSNWSNDFTDGLCLVAAKLVFEHLPRTVADSGDREAGERMANAASISGLGYVNSMVGLAHAMAHALGAALSLPHGRAASMCLPYVLEYYARADGGTRCADITRFLGDAAPDDPGACRALAGSVRTLARAVGLPLNLADAGVNEATFASALPRMLNMAMSDTMIFTSPRQPDDEDLSKLFKCVFSGEVVDF